MPVDVLYVKDNPDNRELVTWITQNQNWSMKPVTSAEEGIEKIIAQAKEYQVILMDISLPGIDGVEATIHLRAQTCSLPIIALTVHALSNEIDRITASGVNTVLSKPLDEELLVATLQPYLRNGDSP